MKIYFDDKIWKENVWFRELAPHYKLVYLYLYTICDFQGMWKIDLEELKKDTKLDSFDLDDFLEQVNIEVNTLSGKRKNRHRIIKTDQNELCVSVFLQSQYFNKSTGRVNANHPIAKRAIETYRQRGILSIVLQSGHLIVDRFLPEHKENIDL